MLINFWYALARSEELDEQPLKTRALDHDFVLFRDGQDATHCLANTCVHRNGSLAVGLIDADCIQCPYHGWQYNGDGVCTRIPTLPACSTIPDSARVDAYPVEERYGLIFAFLGDRGAGSCSNLAIRFSSRRFGVVTTKTNGLIQTQISYSENPSS
jgi:phenylpropionate dioxygenase-like ring-hydroxylating dioxygenase large terminal subunit